MNRHHPSSPLFPSPTLFRSDFPPLQTRFRDRHALVVARGPGHKRDLRIVRPYIRDFKPVLIGVDGGADALLRSEEHTSELQSQSNLVCRLLLEKKKTYNTII